MDTLGTDTSLHGHPSLTLCAFGLGLVVTAGWHVAALIGIARDPQARRFAGWPW